MTNWTTLKRRPIFLVQVVIVPVALILEKRVRNPELLATGDVNFVEWAKSISRSVQVSDLQPSIHPFLMIPFETIKKFEFGAYLLKSELHNIFL